MSAAPNGFETPKTNWQAADVPTPTDFNRIEGNSQAIEEGSRTVDQTQSPSGLVGSLRQFLDWIPNRIKAILGTTNWYDSPPVTLAGAKNHIDNKSNPHSVTYAQAGAAPSSHTHDNRYYTEFEVDTKMAAKVSKPASAVSGNIAVFDGGAGRIKDGGMSQASLGVAINQFIVPGNTIIIESLAEVITPYANTITHFFLLPRAGLYRVTGEVKRTEGTGTGYVYIGSAPYNSKDLTNLKLELDGFSFNSGSYVSFTLDADFPYYPGGVYLCVKLYSGTSANRHAIRNVRVRGETSNTIPNIFVNPKRYLV